MLSYQAILEQLATDIEAISTSGYGDEADTPWHRQRGIGPVDEDWEHLGFKVHLGFPTTLGRPQCLTHEGCFVEWMHRTSADDTFASQGAIMDAGIALMEMLTTWGIPGGGIRTVPEGFRMTEADGEYVKLRTPFHMYIHDWRS